MIVVAAEVVALVYGMHIMKHTHNGRLRKMKNKKISLYHYSQS
jgi:hypothetical protein